MKFPQNHQRLMELLGLVRDGGLDDSQTSELEAMLENDPEALKYYVEAIDLTSTLHRQQGIIDLNPEQAQSVSVTPASVLPAERNWWPSVYWSTALCASLAVGVLLGGKLLTTGGSNDAGQKAVTAVMDESGDEIATLSFAAGCRWSSDDQARHEGQRLRAETLRLDEGVAMVQFDSDVRLVIEGPSQLELVGVDHAMLRHGKAVFRGEGDLDSFTLETPFSKIVDEGTEYGVSVDRSGEVGEVHVFDGRVSCVSPEQEDGNTGNQLIQIDAGDARRISEAGSVEAIKLASSRFVRSPDVRNEPVDSLLAMEPFDYEAEALIGQSGGTGWLGTWSQELRYESAPEPKLRLGESLGWPGKTMPTDGSLVIEGNAGVSRLLQVPIDMNRNAAYYLSFLVRRNALSEKAGPEGWAYVTLRNSEDKAGKISFGPITPRGLPRIVHDGRVANVVSSLRDDVVYLFVCKILARRNKDDLVQVRIYGDHESVDSVEPSTWSSSTRPVRSDSVLDKFRVSAKNSDPMQLDELRLGKTWASVTSPYVE